MWVSEFIKMWKELEATCKSVCFYNTIIMTKNLVVTIAT